MKKFLAFVALTAIITNLCGCNSAKENGKKDAEGSNEQVLTWYIPGDKQSDLPAVMEKANEVLMKKAGVKIDMQLLDSGAYTERMNMNMASGSNFDLCFTGFVNPYRQAAEKGGLYKLDELLVTMPELKNAIPDYAWEGAKINGGIYAVPNLQILALSGALCIQKSYLDKYNYDVSNVKKTEDIEPFLEIIKKNEPDFYPFNSSWGVSSFDMFNGKDGNPKGYTFLSNCVAILNPDGSYTVKPKFEIPVYKESVEKLHDWYKKGYIRKDIASVMDDSAESAAGKYMTWIATYKPGMEASSFANSGREIVAINVSTPTLGRATTAMTAVGKNSVNPQKALEVIQLANTDKEFYNILCFGVEGKHYNKTGENSVEYIENSGYKVNADWKFGNQFNAFTLPGQDPDVWEKTRELNDTAEVSPFLSLEINTDSIKTIVSQVNNVVSTYDTINNGSEDPATYWDTFCKKMTDAGIYKICETVQEQIDEFMKNK